MSERAELGQLQREVQYLKDRLAIADCIARHARGHDRLDAGIITSTYHDDGVDEHGHAINTGPAYAEWANAVHGAGSLLHLHNITTHLCEIEGDTAHCESYVLVGLLNNDGKTARLINGRYVDRIERRDGVWKIALRRATVDLILMGDASILQAPVFKDQGYTRGMRDMSDISYHRPLDLERPVTRW